MQKIRFTKEGFEKAQKEYQDLLDERPGVIEDLQKARELGDLKENGYYQASRQKLTYIDGRLFRLKMDMKYAEIVETTEGNGISIGNQVTLLDGDKERIYAIVGDFEANPAEGKISLLSPIGKALEGKKVGETIHLELPKGKVAYKIISVT